ncbi:MAG: methylmalonyl-CoA epimerase [Paludibacteraceae bacterium]|nr:methylmalonyl-CoA epimerase [Paludibacteraceae bacterium]
MKPTHVEHIGIAVTSLESAMPFFEFLTGNKCYSIEEVADQKVKTAFFKVGEVKVELLEPTSPDSTIAKFIEKNGGRGGVHHIAFNVNSVEEALAEASKAGIELIDKAPRKGAENLMIAFLHPKSTKGVLTEVCEQPK